MSDNSYVFEVTPQNFQTDVIERSRQVPVLVLFWAAQMAPSAQMRQMLEKMVVQFQGKVLLALADVAKDQVLAQHLRVRGLPSLQVVRDGQLVSQVEGPQTETALRQLLDQLTMSSADALREQLVALIETRDFATALGLLRQAIAEEPNNQNFRVELADVQAQQGDLDEARNTLALIPVDTEGRDRPQTRIELMQEAATMDSADALTRELARRPDDLELHYKLAVVKTAAGDYEEALEHAMAILSKDRTFREDIGRLTMIRIFSLLGKGSELATSYRRRMFTFMHR